MQRIGAPMHVGVKDRNYLRCREQILVRNRSGSLDEGSLPFLNATHCTSCALLAWRGDSSKWSSFISISVGNRSTVLLSIPGV